MSGTTLRRVTVGASVLFRLLAYLFLRWLIPAIISALFAVYLTGFAWTASTTSPYNVVADELEIVTKPAVAVSEPVYEPTKEVHTNSSTQAKPLLDANGEQLEELDVKETVTLEEKKPQILRSLLTGLPSPTSMFWSTVTLSINLLLMLMVLDYCYRAHRLYPSHDLVFSRLGYVSHNSAKIVVREPRHVQLPLRLSYRLADPPRAKPSSQFDGAWRHVKTLDSLTNSTDFTGTVTIRDLDADTRYQYALSNKESGFFITAPPPGHFSKRTALQDSFTFVHTSCIIPHFPYNPLHHALHIPGFPHLARWLKPLKPAFMLFLGDFIYIDVPMRHGSDVETYRRPYRHVYASPDWPAASSTDVEQGVADYDDFDVPWLHVYDDHEIENDWSRNTTGVYPAAFDPYLHYHVAPNPPLHGASVANLPVDLLQAGAVTWFSYVHGPAAFFLLDCRRFRNAPNRADSTMLGTQQLSDVLDWLKTPLPAGIRWKFLITSVPFTKNWRVNGKDTWAGYLDERRQLLEAMWDAQTSGPVKHVLLSGDRHEFAATAFSPPATAGWPRDRATVHEFSCSPLDMFYLPVRTYRAARDGRTGAVVPDARDGLEDVPLAYLPDGNHKFGAVTLRRPTVSGQAVLEYRLFAGGKLAWSHVLVAESVETGADVNALWD